MMPDLLKHAYIQLLNFQKVPWVVEGKGVSIFTNNEFTDHFESIDGELYHLEVGIRPRWPYSAIPFELFIKDEFG